MSKRSPSTTAARPSWLVADMQQLHGPFITDWQISKVMRMPLGGLAAAPCVGLARKNARWRPATVNRISINVHPPEGNGDGLVYLAHQLKVTDPGEWDLALGHDGGARLFVDGECVLTEPTLCRMAGPGRSCARVKLSRGRHELVVAMDLAVGQAWGICFQAQQATRRPTPVRICDLSVCTPATALAPHRQPGHWQVLPYAGTGFSGQGLGALPHTGAPEVTLPLNLAGWHAIYLGLASDGTGEGNVIRVKLSGDAALQHRAQRASFCEEVFFKCAEVTGQSLHLAQQTAGYARGACLLYVKLVPLTVAQVAAVQRDRQQRASKRLIGTIDGFSFLYERGATTRAELLEEFEPFRNTDFGTIWWAVTGADQVNYRSRLGTIDGARAGDPPRAGDGYYTESVQTLIARGIDITKVAVEACHEMGISIHISIRPAAWKGPYPYEDYFTSDFYDAHPEWRCRDRDGTSAPRMSFAVPEVRQHLLGIFREVLEAEPDGLNLLYNRGMPLVLWEDAFCDRFRAVYGEDARAVAEDDPRLYDLRAEFLTEWMREVRGLLDAFQQERGLKRRLALSAMCLETEADNRRFGLDVAGWVGAGLVDQIGIFRCSAHTSNLPIDLAYYRRITTGTGVPIFPAMVAWALPKAEEVLKQAVAWYDGGADGLLFWDPSAKVTDGLFWPLVSRAGHVAEVHARAAADPPEPVTAAIGSVGAEPPCRWTAWAGF